MLFADFTSAFNIMVPNLFVWVKFSHVGLFYGPNVVIFYDLPKFVFWVKKKRFLDLTCACLSFYFLVHHNQHKNKMTDHVCSG